MKLRYLVITFCLAISAYHEYLSFQYSSDSYFKGTVIDKHIGHGRDSGFYLTVKFFSHGNAPVKEYTDTLLTSGYEYSKINIGQNFSTEMQYVPILGAVGTAYAGNANYPVIFFLIAVFSKLFLIGFVLYKIKNAFRIRVEW